MTHCPESCSIKRKPLIEIISDEDKSIKNLRSEYTCSLLEEGDRILMVSPEGRHDRIDATSTLSQQLAKKAGGSIPVKLFEDLIPRPYQEFREVFSKESFDQLPPHKP